MGLFLSVLLNRNDNFEKKWLSAIDEGFIPPAGLASYMSLWQMQIASGFKIYPEPDLEI
jgi:hypothetical protein